MRRLFLISALALAGVGLWGIDVAAANASGGGSAASVGNSGPPALPKLPPPPTTIGCYHLRNDVWLRVSCATALFMRRHFPHPELEDGIASAPLTAPPAAPSFVFGSVYLRFAKVGSEKDLHYGANAWSIQNNATFTGTNGQADGVQFTEQSSPPGPAAVCIWQVDITTQKYVPVCTKAPGSFPLDKGDTPDVEGYVRAGGLLALEAYVPWTTATSYAVDTKDTYGLAGRWHNASGSVLGFGNGSQAVFSSAEVETIVDVSSCIGEPGSATCPQSPTLKGHAFSSYSGATEETNNLVPVIGLAPAHLPPLVSLAVDNADIEYVSTVSGLCPGGAHPPLCGLSAGNG